MSNLDALEIHIEGLGTESKVSKSSFDIEDWIDTLKYGRDLLTSFQIREKRQPITVDVQEGSIKFLLTTLVGTVIQANALLSHVNERMDLSGLPRKQQGAIQYFQKLARKSNYRISIGRSGAKNEGLKIDRYSSFTASSIVWAEVSPIIDGIVENIGGSKSPNIHLRTKEFGQLIIKASKEALSELDQNYLYKKVRIEVNIRQDISTGEFDPKSAELVRFLSHESHNSFEEYLDTLIEKATPALSKISNKEEWLSQIRGYVD
ncbi:hypothetical protein [Pontibacter sp. G13]|uniref:hypothetical protein n=1 Tax=Pontibacter sp. G13 TaxID=3074898 RepID=UPI00288AE992|nr:hypothetical protein [Pontibacter sp. G13]WNJ21002.1 hypothetical protein RJD25_11065 [Pontibacter sp. G13]